METHLLCIKYGRNARKAIEESRSKVANLIGAKNREIYFTSCGSESDNTAIKGIAMANKDKGNHIITTKIEHHAILNSCRSLEKQGFEVTYINVDKDGFVDLGELVESIRNSTILISVMFANNEIGTIEPIEEISKIAKDHNIIFHTDAVQAVGNVKINVEKMGIDLLSISGHKIYGPKGVGALYVRNGIDFDTFIDGGHQERGKRAGTENVAGIVGIGKAAELAQKSLDNHIQYLTNLRNYYISKIMENFKNCKLNGSKDKRLPGNANISFIGANGEEILLKLDAKGICASTGSACNSGIDAPSEVLTAIGLDQKASQGALRVTFGDDNDIKDVDFLIESLKEIIE